MLGGTVGNRTVAVIFGRIRIDQHFDARNRRRFQDMHGADDILLGAIQHVGEALRRIGSRGKMKNDARPCVADCGTKRLPVEDDITGEEFVLPRDPRKVFYPAGAASEHGHTRP